MKKILPFDAIIIDKKSQTPIYRQLYELIKHAIIHRQFPAHSQLPSSRQLATELNISRSTVTAAYDQLIAEGFLISKRGSGTVIAEALSQSSRVPSNRQKTRQAKQKQAEHEKDLRSQLSDIASTYCKPQVQQRIRTNYEQTTLMPGIPSRQNFPNAIWGKLLAKYAKQPLGIDAGYDHPSGIPQLKKAIADYIRLARGVNTKDQDVLIISSTQAALDLLCRVILNKGENAGLEEPGYRGAYLAMRNSGAKIHGIPVDSEGITIPKLKKSPKLIYTSPSHQYPTGTTMSYARRMALLEYAQQQQCWIMEDDYDSEFRYRSKPLPSLQGLDQNQRVIYLGTFSKSLSPAMRVAYIVAPSTLSPIIKTFLGDIGAGINIAVQYALAEFIDAGHYARHIRKARKEYAEKQQLLNSAINKYLHGKVDYYQSNAGLQATLYFKPNLINDILFIKEAEKHGLYLRPLSLYYQTEQSRQGIVLGFAACNKDEIDRAVEKLASLISVYMKK